MADGDRQERAREIVRGLERAYPDATCALHFSNPLELLVATILSAQCTDERVNQVTQSLFKKYPRPEDYAMVPLPELEEDVHPTGFFRQKARSLNAMGRMLVDQFGARVPDTMEEMTRLPGVARKTANVVLGTAFGIPTGIVVDTHVRRLSYRMELSDETDPDKIEQDLMALIPQEQWIWFGHAMIRHGRRVCMSRAPDCPHCVLNQVCPKRGVGARSTSPRAGRGTPRPDPPSPPGRGRRSPPGQAE